MLLSNLTRFLEEWAPLPLQESYDNSGLLIGNPSAEITKALINLDCTEEVMEEAIAEKAQLIITHHPIIFSGLKKITGRTYIERIVQKAIKHDIALYAIHTNLDNVQTGVNARIAQKMGLQNTRILAPKTEQLRKLVVFCPIAQGEALRQALFAAGAGHVGNYDACSFSSSGTGTFRAGEGTNPFVGEQGKLHQESEERIEVIYPLWREATLLAALKATHPYEEPAFDCYTLGNAYPQVGAGMIGELPQEMGEEAFLDFIKQTFHAKGIRHTALLGKKIKTVALCGGSGSFLLSNAVAQGAEAFITADFKYHQFFDADRKLLLADIGHYETEQFTSDLLLENIRNKFPTFAVQLSKTVTNPVFYR